MEISLVMELFGVAGFLLKGIGLVQVGRQEKGRLLDGQERNTQMGTEQRKTRGNIPDLK